MGIAHFTFDADFTHSFVRFGYDLYRGDPHWIPPLKKDLYTQLSPDFPFYRKLGNGHRHFLATAGGKVVGRVSALVNRDLRDEDGTPVGAIGFFECSDDDAVAKELLDAATGWLRDEHGIERIWGPMNFDIWHGYRLMTRGFDQKLFYGEPYNKRYYQDFFERYGFTPKQHWHSVEVTGRDTLERMIAAGAERYQKLVKRGYRFEQFNSRMFSDELRKLHSVLTRSFGAFLAFTPISLAEFEQLFATGRYGLNSELFTFVYNEHNILAGFAGAFLDLADAIRAMKEKNDLLAKLRFFYHRRLSNRILFYLCGVTPEEATKETDFGRAGFYYIIRQILKEGYETVLIALMARSAPMACMAGRNITAPQRQYTLYELNP